MAMTLQAEITVKDYRQQMSLADRRMLEIHMAGLGTGIAWANAQAERFKTPLYCPPGKLAIQTENYIDIINRKIKESSERIPASHDHTPIVMLLLDGLMKTFPCTSGK
jgi:hypothetical protein